jgi:hypothetical protein
MFNNSININKTNNDLSPKIIEHKREHTVWCWKSKFWSKTGVITLDKFETKMQRVRQWNDADDIIEACVWTKYRFWFCNNPSLCCSVGWFYMEMEVVITKLSLKEESIRHLTQCESLKSDVQQFHQYQQNKQRPLT